MSDRFSGLSSEYFECACSCDEHRLVFTFDPEDQEIYLSTFLAGGRFWERLKRGVKYIFGYKCKYGHFDCTVFKPRDIIRLKNLMQSFEDFCHNNSDKVEPWLKRELAE